MLCKVLVGVFALFHGAPAIADNAVRAGDVIVDPPTLYCLGFRWMVSGDENGNARGDVSYRAAGEAEWTKALPLLRINREQTDKAF